MAAVFGQSMGETSLLQAELRGFRGQANAQYDFGHVQQMPPPSSYMQRASRAGLPTQGGGGQAEGPLRPMTSNCGAGYTPQGVQAAKENGTFDPFSAGGAPGKTLQKK